VQLVVIFFGENMYLLIDEDGTVKEAQSLPDSISWDCWPRAIKIDLYAGPDLDIFELKSSGWQKVQEI